MGITTTRSIWATDIRYMNDGAELRQAIDLTREYMEFRSENPRSAIHSEVCSKIVAYLDNAWESELFAVSLTAAGDLLSQWRAYAGGGGGYSIGFETSGLESLVQSYWGALFQPCIYAIEEQRNAVDSALHSIFDCISQTDATNRGDIVARSFSSFFTAFSRYAPLFKHPSFVEEQEWRIVLSGPPPEGRAGVRYRIGRGTLIPYRVIPLERAPGMSPMTEVVIGPTPFPELALRSTTQFLSGQRIQFSTVQCSHTPYRSW